MELVKKATRYSPPRGTKIMNDMDNVVELKIAVAQNLSKEAQNRKLEAENTRTIAKKPQFTQVMLRKKEIDHDLTKSSF